MEIKSGSKVKLDYTGTLEDGTIFDTSKGREPLNFTAGQGMLIKGFESAILGMKEGEEKKFTVTPEEAYGVRNPELIQKVPKDKMNLPGEIKKGMTLAVTAPDGQQFPVQVADVTETEVHVDLNHPLAGKTLTFEIKIIGVE